MIGESDPLSPGTDSSANRQSATGEAPDRTAYDALVDAVPLAVVTLDLDGLVTGWNQAAEKIFGWSRSEVLGRRNPIVAEDQWSEFEAAAAQTLAGGPLRGVELERRRKDGSTVWVRLYNSVLFNTAGEPIGFLGILEDVTRERALATRNEKLLAATLDGFILADRTGRILDVNPSYCRLSGYGREELCSKTIFDLESALDDQEIESKIAAMIAAGSARFETRHRRKDGREIDLDVSITILESRDGPLVAAFVRDITDERRARADLDAERARWQALAECSPDHIMLLDPDGVIRYINRTVPDLTPAEVLGHRFLDFIPEADHAASAAALRQAAAGEVATYRTRYITKDGETRFFDVRLAPLIVDGAVTAVISASTDVTARVRDREALLESERRLATLLDNLPGFAYRCINDDRWTMEFISDGCRKLTGYEPAQLVANRDLSYADLIHPDDRQTVWNEVQAGLARGEPFVLTYRIVTAAGDTRWVWERGRGIPGDEGHHGDHPPIRLEGFVTDVTEQIEAESSLRESESRFRGLFEGSPISLWLEDASMLKPRLQALAAEHGDNLGEWLAEHPEEIEACVGLMRIIDVNPATLALFGAASKEELTSGLGGTFSPESYEVFRQELVALAGGATTFEHDHVIFRGRDGPLVTALRVTVAPGAERDWSRIYVAMTDLTALAAAERSLADSGRMWQATFDAMDDPVFVLDREQRVQRANAAAGKLLSRSPSELVGGHCFELVHGADSPIDGCPVQRCFATNANERHEHDLRGRTFVESADTVRDSSGEITGAVVAFRDITARKQAEDELKKLNTELEARVADRTAELRKAVDLMAGREIRMAELKEEIRALRRQLEAAGIEPAPGHPPVGVGE